MRDISPEVREFLSAFKSRPGMYLGHDGMITELRLFLDGMRAAPLIYGDRDKTDIIPYELHDFTAKYYGESSSTAGWCNIILNHELDERSAFEKFWELLDECLISGGVEPLKRIERVPTECTHRDDIYNILHCDLSKLADSLLKCGETAEEQAKILSRFVKMYRTPDFFGLAIWRDNFPIGAVLGNIEKRGGDKFRINELWVIPEERRKGYARQLIGELRRLLSLRGYTGDIYAAADEAKADILGKYFGFSERGSLKIMELPRDLT